MCIFKFFEKLFNQSFLFFSYRISFIFFLRNYPILPTVSEVEDDDVAMERSKVLGGHCNNAVLRMESLTKVKATM